MGAEVTVCLTTNWHVSIRAVLQRLVSVGMCSVIEEGSGQSECIQYSILDCCFITIPPQFVHPASSMCILEKSSSRPGTSG